MRSEERDNLVHLASRNAMILLWLRDLDESKAGINPIQARKVAREYADEHAMPLCEVEHALHQLTAPADLNWMWARYEADIVASDFLRS